MCQIYSALLLRLWNDNLVRGFLRDRDAFVSWQKPSATSAPYRKHLSFGLCTRTMFWTATFSKLTLSFWPLLTTPPSRPGLIASSMPDGFAISSGADLLHSWCSSRKVSLSTSYSLWSPTCHRTHVRLTEKPTLSFTLT